MDNCLGTGSRGQGKLVRLARGVDWLGIVLGEASGNQSSQDISNDDSTDSAVWFGEGHHASKTDG